MDNTSISSKSGVGSFGKTTSQISGQLCKYTNVVKGKMMSFDHIIDLHLNEFVYGHLTGWQYRWFTVDPQAGTLSYFICDNVTEDSSPPNISGNTPRWQVITN